MVVIFITIIITITIKQTLKRRVNPPPSVPPLSIFPSPPQTPFTPTPTPYPTQSNLHTKKKHQTPGSLIAGGARLIDQGHEEKRGIGGKAIQNS